MYMVIICANELDMGILCHFLQQNMLFYAICLVKYVLKMPKFGKICDSEIQISRGYISGKTTGFKPFIIQVFLLKGASVWHGDPNV